MTKSKLSVTFDRIELLSSSFDHSNRENLSFRMVKTRAQKLNPIKSYRQFTFGQILKLFWTHKHTRTPCIIGEFFEIKRHLGNFSNEAGKIRFFRGNIPLTRSKTKFSPKILTKIKKKIARCARGIDFFVI